MERTHPIADLSPFINKRYSIAEVYPVMEIVKQNFEQIEGVEQVSVVGSVRRMQDTIGDIDFVVSSPTPLVVLQKCMQLPITSEVMALGRTSVTIKVKNPLNKIPIDILIVKPHLYAVSSWLLTGAID